MEIIINGTKVEGNIKEISMTDACGKVTVLKSPGGNECRIKGEYFYCIDVLENIVQLVELRDSYCDDLYKINNYFVTKEDAEKEVRRRQMRREFGKYFNRYGDYTLIHTRGSKDIKIVKINNINLHRIGDFIFMEKDIDNVRELIEEYREDILVEMMC